MKYTTFTVCRGWRYCPAHLPSMLILTHSSKHTQGVVKFTSLRRCEIHSFVTQYSEYSNLLCEIRKIFHQLLIYYVKFTASSHNIQNIPVYYVIFTASSQNIQNLNLVKCTASSQNIPPTVNLLCEIHSFITQSVMSMISCLFRCIVAGGTSMVHMA